MDDFHNFLDEINAGLEAMLTRDNNSTDSAPTEAPPELEVTTLTDDDFQEILRNISPEEPAPEPEEESEEDMEDLEEELEDEVREPEESNEWPDEAVAEQTSQTTENPSFTPSYVITPNSPTYTIKESTSRFSGAEWYEKIKNSIVLFAGVGGIGSNAIFQIARMAPRTIFCYDDDIVEESNMSGQLFSREDIGKYKVDAIARMVNTYTDTDTFYANRERYTRNSLTNDIMICGFDNMEARKTFYFKWKEHVLFKPQEERKECLFIDGRLSISVLQVICITGVDDYYMQWYEDSFLFSDSEVEETVCSMKQTTYMACMIGSMITNLFTNFIANTLEPAISYNLPFFTEYDAQHMIFKIEK